MLVRGPDHGRRGFRPKGQTLAALIGEGVHLFLDDVGPLPDAPDEELGPLKDGRPDLLVAEAFQDPPGLGLDALPATDLGGQNVGSPPDPLDRGRDLAHSFTSARQRAPPLYSTRRAMNRTTPVTRATGRV